MASTEVEERWQAQRKTISERNKYMFNNPLMSDIKFAFPNTDTVIPAHKYVLAVSSPVFFAMFYGDLAETRGTIDITDCDPGTFLLFLSFLYCDEANFVSADCAIKVWYLADKYDVPLLAREIVMYIDGNMHPLSAFDVIPYARQINDQSLETACWEVIDFNAVAIAACESFLNIKHEFLVSFLQRSSLRIEEATLFKAVDRWAAKRCKEAGMTVNGANKRDAIGEDLLKYIRFPLMSPEQFSDVVLAKEILTKDEVIDVLKSFSNLPVHGGLKFSVHPRETSADTAYIVRVSSVHKMSQGFIEHKKLIFSVEKRVLLCGLEFLFRLNDSRRCLSLSLWRTGEKIKDISAKPRKNYGCSFRFPSSQHDRHDKGTKVFFNRPICLEAETCYTIKLIEASSRSQEVCVSPDSMSQKHSVFRYYGSSRSDEISQKRPYSGFVSALIFTTCSGLVERETNVVPTARKSLTFKRK